MKQDSKLYDVTIIGGGPAGMFTAFYGGMRQLEVKLIESLPQLGGQLAALYPEKYIYDIAGFPKIRAKELVNNLKEQMSAFEQAIVTSQSVEAIDKLEDGTFKLTTNNEIHYSKTVIITAGLGAFQPRKLEVEGADYYEDKNLHYFINSINEFEGKNIVIFGGGDSAIDWSLMLEPIAKKVTLVHRRNQFRAHEHSVEKLFNSSIEIKTPYMPDGVFGDEKGIKQIVIRNQEGEKETLEVDDIIVNYGFKSSLGPIKEWGLEIEKNSIVVNPKMETNIEGIYAVGDVTTFDGKVKLISTGFGEAPVAISAARLYIDPTAKKHVPHSTDLFKGEL
ncbi:MAG: NAD(P)/FAD-dependent oxidoreductase [Solibacillus sp.]|uniref:NAD(P)/FAD-dependent oxidoreductase n=1 Tax=Solibacillus sp. TaxID=1909654 RepID=UPI00331488A0